MTATFREADARQEDVHLPKRHYPNHRRLGVSIGREQRNLRRERLPSNCGCAGKVAGVGRSGIRPGVGLWQPLCADLGRIRNLDSPDCATPP